MPRTFSRARSICSALLAGRRRPAVRRAGDGAGTTPSCRRLPLRRRRSRPRPRAFIEGRYAEVDTLTAKLDLKDPNVVALRARAAIARGLIRRRGIRVAGGGVACARRARPRSSSACCSRCSSRPDARRRWLASRPLAETSQNARELARAGRRAARARPHSGRQGGVPRGARAWPRTTPRSRRRSAICFSRNTTTPKRSSRYQRVRSNSTRVGRRARGRSRALERR